MLDKPLDKPIVNEFSHTKPSDTLWRMDGLRDFFLYKDMGVAASTGGRVICQLVKANPARPPEHGTGWHQHIADFHIVIMTKGWARFMYNDKEHLVAAGDCVHQQPGIPITCSIIRRTWNTSKLPPPPILARLTLMGLATSPPQPPGPPPPNRRPKRTIGSGFTIHGSW